MFKPVDPKNNFPEMERKLLAWWYKSGLVQKYLHKNDKSPKRFSFLDGPITANNPMGVHHGWSRTYKDLWQRYFNMKGSKQRFQNGFDCQGLWVEVEVEKELGFKNKKDIDKYGIAEFVEKCKERVRKYAAIQTEQSKRLGYFMDWENSYYTMSDENNYMIWHFLKKCHEKSLIYKGRDSVPWCPRCGTAISQHEMLTEDYKEATHDSIYIRYPIRGKEKTFLLVWTTTPWTLPGNVVVALDSDKEYALAADEKGNNYYLLKSQAQSLGLKVKEAVKGKELVGLKYDSPFDELPRVKKSLADFVHEVVATDNLIMPVSEEEGTGMVHTAPGAGTEDFQLGKKLKLPTIELIGEEANYYDNLGEFSTLNAKEHPELIIDFLKKKDNGQYLFKVLSYTHRYPACWRCKTELVWRVVNEWYIAMDPLREPLRKIVKKITWLPEFGLDRELDWINNMHDWLISKKRYWGLALPIWECPKCGHFEVLGGQEELKERAVEGYKNFEGHTPHRPWIDEIKIKCSKCNEIVSRIKDVGNPWLDAGIVSFSTISKDNKSEPFYLKDKVKWREWFPVDFITESFPGQFKNWFYSLLAMSAVLENEEPFKTVLGFGTLLGEDGRPMHKSWGNAIEFNEGADKIGVDVMRWMYVTQNPADNLLFGYHKADEVRRRFHLTLWNVYNFFITYANADEFKSLKSKVKSQNVLDRWIVSRLHELIKTVTESLDKYDAQTASLSVEEFVQDLSLWYVRRSRDRIGPAAAQGEDKKSCYETLYTVLVTLSKLLAPFTPFMSEEIYKNLTGEESVHLSDWPESVYRFIDTSINKEMEETRKICELGHAVRKQAGIKVRQPLGKVRVKNVKLAKEYEQLIEDELNVKMVEWAGGKGEPTVELDTTITPELKLEGEARDLIRQIQELRKEKGLKPGDKIRVAAPEEFKKFAEEIKKRTNTEEIIWGKPLQILTG